MAASSSGSNNESNNAMEEGASGGESGGSGTNKAQCVDMSFEEFLRQRQEESMQGCSSSGSGSPMLTGNVEVDESPLKPSINRNKESLKLKLQMRRPITQLVEQGILPSPNTPPAYACQRVKLERARMGDLLKAKIQQRPSRQELVRQHILEETDPRVAPLLAEKQRMLKRARLADSLNDHLIHRPGPLELVQKNILHAPDESIEKAIKEGIVPFKATCEGATPGPPLPTKYICQEDDSSSDVSSPSVNLDSVSAEENAPTPAPASVPDLSVPETVLEVQNQNKAAAAAAAAVTILLPAQPIVCPPSVLPQVPAPTPPPPPPPPPPYQFSISDLQGQQNIGIFAVPIFGNVPTTTQPQSMPIMAQQQPVFQSSQQQPLVSSSNSFKSRSKKISKSKSQSKPKTIKFHEYRGPPGSAQKSSLNNCSDQGKRPAESSYELLLQQQQLFLQWQLDLQHRFPKILLPAVSKMSAEEKKAFCSTLQSSTFPSTVVSHHHQHPNLHPIISSDSLPVQILSNPTNSVLILSSTNNEPSTMANNTHPTVTYIPQQQQQHTNNNTAQHTTTTTLVFTTPAAPASSSISQTPAATAITTSSSAGAGGLSKIDNATAGGESKGAVAPTSPFDGGQPSKLNDWKVNELKAELKKRNLPVSGSKSQLVERLQASYLKTEKEAKPVEQAAKKNEECKENGSTELKFFITNNNSTPTLINSGALEFLQKSGILKSSSGGGAIDGKELEGVPTIQPSSRSVLQQKIQLKMQQQQQAKTQLNNLNMSQIIKNEPGTSTVVNELRTWMPVSSPLATTAVAFKPDEAGISTESVKQDSTVVRNHYESDNPWVLKITETSTTPSASFENCLADLLSDATSQPPSTINHEIQDSAAAAIAAHVKSQMVDDVLEILIRNGELPASAAQHVVAGQSSTNPQGKDFKPPPAPPLPPTTFAVTLPTEISFRRLAQPQPFLQQKENGGGSGRTSERKGSLGITSLTKEAEEILKIREDLVTTCENNKSTPLHHQHHQSSSSILFLTPQQILIKKEEEEFMELEDNNSPMSHHHNMEMNLKPSKSSQNNINHGDSIVIDELLTEALEFPMDTEYSDWLESFSSDNTFNNFNNHNNLDKINITTTSSSCEDSHNRGDPLLSSTKTFSTNRLSTILDNSFPPLDHSGNTNSVLMMDICSDNNSSSNNLTNSTETDLLKIRKEDNVNVNLNTVNDLWDFSF